jgi:hypothetical protein
MTASLTVRYIGATLLGLLSVAILSVATDTGLEHLGILPQQNLPETYSNWMLASALLYRSIYTIIGGYLTVIASPHEDPRPLYAVMALGALGGTAGALFGWDLGHHWYPVSLAITGPLFVWLGGEVAIYFHRNSQTEELNYLH